MQELILYLGGRRQNSKRTVSKTLIPNLDFQTEFIIQSLRINKF